MDYKNVIKLFRDLSLFQFYWVALLSKRRHQAEDILNYCNCSTQHRIWFQWIFLEGVPLQDCYLSLRDCVVHPMGFLSAPYMWFSVAIQPGRDISQPPRSWLECSCLWSPYSGMVGLSPASLAHPLLLLCSSCSAPPCHCLTDESYSREMLKKRECPFYIHSLWT